MKTVDIIETSAQALYNALRSGTPIGPLTDAHDCLLYTSPSPRDRQKSRMPSSA